MVTLAIKLWKCQTVLGCWGPKGPPLSRNRVKSGVVFVWRCFFVVVCLHLCSHCIASKYCCSVQLHPGWSCSVMIHLVQSCPILSNHFCFVPYCSVLFCLNGQRKKVGILLGILPHVREQYKLPYFPRPGQS